MLVGHLSHTPMWPCHTAPPPPWQCRARPAELFRVLHRCPRISTSCSSWPPSSTAFRFASYRPLRPTHPRKHHRCAHAPSAASPSMPSAAHTCPEALSVTRPFPRPCQAVSDAVFVQSPLCSLFPMSVMIFLPSPRVDVPNDLLVPHCLSCIFPFVSEPASHRIHRAASRSREEQLVTTDQVISGAQFLRSLSYDLSRPGAAHLAVS